MVYALTIIEATSVTPKARSHCVISGGSAFHCATTRSSSGSTTYSLVANAIPRRPITFTTHRTAFMEIMTIKPRISAAISGARTTGAGISISPQDDRSAVEEARRKHQQTNNRDNVAEDRRPLERLAENRKMRECRTTASRPKHRIIEGSRLPHRPGIGRTHAL